MAKTIKIRFNETRVVQDGTGTTFESGKVYDLPEDSANHWLTRNVAEVVQDAPKQTAQKTTSTKTKDADK